MRRSRFALPVCALLVLSGVVGAPAHADGMRCGNDLVSDGDTRAEVERLCGAPAEVETRSIVRRPHFIRRGQVIYYGDGVVDVEVELWTYNFGPNRFMRRVRFVDGIVEEIATLGYGYH